MKKQKETFIFYTNWLEYIKELNPDDILQLLIIICDYTENLIEPKKTNLSDRLLMTWLFIKNRLDIDKSTYDKRCETSKENGKKGGRPKKEKNLKNLKNPKKHDNDNDNDYDNDNDFINSTITTTINKKNNVVVLDIFTFIENNFGRTLSPVEYEEISKWEDNELTRYAIKNAVLNGKCNIKYISRILESYAKNGIKTVVQAQNEEEEFKNQKEQKQKYQGMSFREQELLRQEEITKQWLEEG